MGSYFYLAVAGVGLYSIQLAFSIHAACPNLVPGSRLKLLGAHLSKQKLRWLLWAWRFLFLNRHSFEMKGCKVFFNCVCEIKTNRSSHRIIVAYRITILVHR